MLILSTVAFAAGNVTIKVNSCTGGSVSVTYGSDTSKQVLTGGNSAAVASNTDLTVSATPKTGYKLVSLTVNKGSGAVEINDGDVLNAASSNGTMTFDAKFELKDNGGDGASINSFTINAICAGGSNWYYYHKDTTGNRKYAKYISTGGGATNSSEITSGDYVDLTVYISDADFSKFVGDADLSKVSVSTTGNSVLRASSYTSYNKDVPGSGITVTKNASGYVLNLPALIYNGASGNLELLVSYGKYNAKISAPIKNTTANPTVDEDQKYPTTDAAKPYIIIRSYSYGKGDLVAGETRNVTMTFYNTSKTMSVENMMVTMTLPADAMVLTSSSNTFYVESLGAGKSITKTVNVTVKPTAAAQSQAMTVNFTYDYLDGSVRKSTSTEESISMPIVQVDRFTVTGVDLETNIYTGQESGLTVNYVNKGRSDVYNISAKLNCPGLANDGAEVYIGNLSTGTTNTADFYITPQDTGELSGEVIITYEDTNMQQRTVTVPFTTTVASFEDPGAMNPGTMYPGGDDPGMIEPETGGQGLAWYWIVLGVFVIGGGVFWFLKKRKKKENVDEDEDF